MPPKPLPKRVAVQSDRPHPEWRGFPHRFHAVGAKHLARGSHLTRNFATAKALAEGWQPCRICFRPWLPGPEKALARSLKGVADADLLARLPESDRPAPRRAHTRFEPVRDDAVIELVLRRASSSCERPGCVAELFETDGGEPYVEVHHLTLLADGGADHPTNAAALCPSCHRRLHFGRDREDQLTALRNHVAVAHAAFVARVVPRDAEGDR